MSVFVQSSFHQKTGRLRAPPIRIKPFFVCFRTSVNRDPGVSMTAAGVSSGMVILERITSVMLIAEQQKGPAPLCGTVAFQA